ncbi:hypothetical protein [Marinicella gelatinilytica]|uniref:hypothetical protein n=1 Tax=Marinicella gelatinilytica TaxID=2996017 RepID=UPI002260FFB6|nr:hypothetical protein [Marinicella gelatinilytica]MCX7544886.1 hypothetical protein [Marinicella gelatinilytica]
MSDINESRPEFAPLYSRRERWRILLKALLIVAPLALWAQFWFFPWFNTFIRTAHCRTILNMDGLTATMLLMLVGAPLLLALVLLFTEGRKSWRVYQLKQTPLPDEKVMVPTRYRYGNRALLRPLGLLLSVLILLGLAIWSYFPVNRLMEDLQPKNKNCSEITAQLTQSD